MPTVKKNRAVFLDRDGTINEEVGYLDSLDKLVLIPRAAAAIKLINASGMKAVVITNQAGVAKGYFQEEFVGQTHARISALLAREGAFLDRFYYCPHHPTEGEGVYRQACSCRKPAAGMLFLAAAELDIDLGASYLIGDTLRDMEAAANAGVRGILVGTGYGGNTGDPALDGSGVKPAHRAADIFDAVRWIMEDREK